MYKLHADCFCQQPTGVIESCDQLIQTSPFYFLTLDVGQRVVKVEHNAALLQLPDHESRLITSCRIWHSNKHATLCKSSETEQFSTALSLFVSIFLVFLVSGFCLISSFFSLLTQCQRQDIPRPTYSPFLGHGQVLSSHLPHESNSLLSMPVKLKNWSVW